MADPVTPAEIAADLGHPVAWFYRHRARLHAVDGLPAPIASTGRPRWDRASYGAWRGRHHPAAPARGANDTAPPLAPDDVDAWRAWYARSCGGEA